jgi:hypothetical protein
MRASFLSPGGCQSIVDTILFGFIESDSHETAANLCHSSATEFYFNRPRNIIPPLENENLFYNDL